MLSDGMNVEPRFQIQVLNSKVAQAAVREASLEAAVQQLLAENKRLEATMQAMKEAAEEQIEQEG